MDVFSVLTYNCNRGLCKDYGSIGDLIVSTNADIVCLQEYNVNVSQQLEPYKLENYYVFITPPMVQGWVWNVIYSKFPVVKTRFLELEEKSKHTPIITLQLPDRLLTIACVHLEPKQCRSELRLRQYKHLLDNVADVDILIGDFNFREKEVPWPAPGWNSPQLLPTYVSGNPCIRSRYKFAHPFDRCLYRNLVAVTINVIGDKIVSSDHYGLLITFQYPVKILPIADRYLLHVPAASMKHILLDPNIWIVGLDDKWLEKAITL